MDDVSQISEFGKILIFLITGAVLVSSLFFVNRLIAPSNPNAEKQSTYECGEDTVGSAWLPFNSRFYVIALVFLLFDVEMVFVFPWATVFGNHDLLAADARWGWVSLAEMFIFLGILILGLVYVWRKGDLEWIKPSVVIPSAGTRIPQSLYEKLNQDQGDFKVRALAFETTATPVAAISAVETASSTVKKPMFKPSFKKPANDA